MIIRRPLFNLVSVTILAMFAENSGSVSGGRVTQCEDRMSTLLMEWTNKESDHLCKPNPIHNGIRICFCL